MKTKTDTCPRCEGRGEVVQSVTYEGEWMTECPECQTKERTQTPKTDEAWENNHPLYRLSDNEKRELCGKFEAEAGRLKMALLRAAKWGIRSDGFSGEVSDALRVWIDGGMVGDPPEVPPYYPKTP